MMHTEVLSPSVEADKLPLDVQQQQIYKAAELLAALAPDTALGRACVDGREWGEQEVSFTDGIKQRLEHPTQTEKTEEDLLYLSLKHLGDVDRRPLADREPGATEILRQPEDFIAVWQVFETLADTEVFETGSDAYLLDFLDFLREDVTKPDNDLKHMLAEHPGLADPIRLYAALEHAQAGDLLESQQLLQEMESSPKLQALLVSKLQEASRRDSPELSTAVSAENLEMLSTALHPESAEKAESLQLDTVHVGINTTLQTVEELFDPFSGGRYLTSFEHAVKGGSERPDRNRGQRNDGLYKANRLRTEESLGFTTNIFERRPIYGALTSDSEAKGGAEHFGEVVIVPKADALDRGATYTWGDSLSVFLPEVTKRHITPEDAKRAYGLMVAESQGYGHARYNSRDHRSELGYIEVQLPGLKLDDVESVTFYYDVKAKQLDQYLKTADLVARHGIDATVSLDWQQASEYASNPMIPTTKLVERITVLNPAIKLEIKVVQSEAEAPAVKELQKMSGVRVRIIPG